MPFDPIAEGLWDRKNKIPVADVAVTIVNLDPRIVIITFKSDGKYHDFMVAEDHMEYIASTIQQALPSGPEIMQGNQPVTPQAPIYFCEAITSLS